MLLSHGVVLDEWKEEERERREGREDVELEGINRSMASSLLQFDEVKLSELRSMERRWWSWRRGSQGKIF